MARSLLKGNSLPNQFWAKAVATSVYLLNISPTKAVLNQTPFEAWKGTKPLVSHLRSFGYIAYALANSQNHQKLDENLRNAFSSVIVFNLKYIDSITLLVAK